MRVLVTAASRHGSTFEIAEAIAEVLTDRGLTADVKPVEHVSTLDPYDAVVLGSAIYYGHWMKTAIQFADTFVDDLVARPVWMFSSGPVESTEPAADEAEAPPLEGAIVPRGYRVFLGALDKGELGLAERSIVRVVGAGYGDFRQWDEIRAWAESIAGDLTKPS